jgi:hypothetical protein
MFIQLLCFTHLLRCVFTKLQLLASVARFHLFLALSPRRWRRRPSSG